MPKVVAITNQKGGIGKTTSAVAITSILNSMGHKTLLIDADAQKNASSTFRAKVENAATLYDVLLDRNPIPIQEAIQHTEYADVVAGDPLLVKADAQLSVNMNGLFSLKDALEGVDGYEYIIIDTAPALGELTKSVLVAADEVLIPVKASSYSIDGLDNAVQAVNAVKNRVNPKLTIGGLILVSYPVRTKLGKEVKTKLQSVADRLNTVVLEPPIREAIAVEEAHFAHMPILYYDRKSTAAQDYIALVNHFLEVHENGYNTTGHPSKLNAFCVKALLSLMDRKNSEIGICKVTAGSYASQWNQPDGTTILATAQSGGDLRAAIRISLGVHSRLPGLGNSNTHFDPTSILALYILIEADRSKQNGNTQSITWELLDTCRKEWESTGVMNMKAVYMVNDALYYGLTYKDGIPCSLAQGNISLLASRRIASGEYASTEVLFGRPDLFVPQADGPQAIQEMTIAAARAEFAEYIASRSWTEESSSTTI